MIRTLLFCLAVSVLHSRSIEVTNSNIEKLEEDDSDSNTAKEVELDLNVESLEVINVDNEISADGCVKRVKLDVRGLTDKFTTEMFLDASLIADQIASNSESESLFCSDQALIDIYGVKDTVSWVYADVKNLRNLKYVSDEFYDENGMVKLDIYNEFLNISDTTLFNHEVISGCVGALKETIDRNGPTKKIKPIGFKKHSSDDYKFTLIWEKHSSDSSFAIVALGFNAENNRLIFFGVNDDSMNKAFNTRH